MWSGLAPAVQRSPSADREDVWYCISRCCRLSVRLWALYHSRRDHCTVCWSWFTCTLMSCCWLLREEVSSGSHIWWGLPHFSGPSLLHPFERRVFLVAPGLALLHRRSGISDFYSVCCPQSLMASAVLTGLLFFEDHHLRGHFARILHAELPSNLLMEPACHFANYLDRHITSLLIQVHWANADSCWSGHSSGPFRFA